MAMIMLAGMGGLAGYVPDAKIAPLVHILSQMPGYNALYSHMTSIMYAAGVQPGTQLENEMIGAGYYMIAFDPRMGATMKSNYRTSNVLVEMDAQLDNPEYANSLKQMIQKEVARRGASANSPYVQPPPQQQMPLEPYPVPPGVHIDANGGCVDDSTGKYTDCDGSQLANPPSKVDKPADKTVDKPADGDMGLTKGMDNKTLMLVAAAAVVLLMMSKE